MTAREATIDKETLRLIKQIILEESKKLGVKVEKIILFGSRARGDYREDSDYDILIIVRGKIDRATKHLLSARISLRVARQLLIPVDIIVTTRERWREYADVIGTIEEVAANEGIPV